jgi:hypothetical protein
MPIHKFGHSKEQLQQQQFYYDIPIRLEGSLSPITTPGQPVKYVLREIGSSTYTFNIESGGEIVSLSHAPLLHINDKLDINPIGKKLNQGDKLSFASYSTTNNYPVIHIEIIVRCQVIIQK